MSNALLPSWANGTVKEAADMLARTALTKKALNLGQTLSGAASKVTDWAKSNPDIAKPLGVVGGAAALGGGLAGLSSLRRPKEERQTLRSMLRGALAGGALGGGGYAAMKATNLDKKLPELYDKARKSVSDRITGGTSSGDVPGLDQVNDIMGTVGLSDRDTDAALIGRANKAERAENLSNLYSSIKDPAVIGMTATLDATKQVGGDAMKNLATSPTGFALGATAAGDYATRQLGASAAHRGMVDIRSNPINEGIERIRAAGGASSEINRAALKELIDMPAAERVRHFEALNNMARSPGYSGNSYRVLPGGSRLTRDFAQTITNTPNRRGGLQSLQYLLDRSHSGAPATSGTSAVSNLLERVGQSRLGSSRLGRPLISGARAVSRPVVSGARAAGNLADDALRAAASSRPARMLAQHNPIGGKWGKLLSLVPYLVAAGAPQLLPGESTSPIIRDLQQAQAQGR